MGMLIPLLSLALAVLPAAPASAAMSASRRDEITRLSAEWTSYRNSANRMMTAFPGAAAKDGWSQTEMIAFVGKVRVLLASVEDEEAATADIAREALRASEPPSAARLEREKAVTAVYESRALTLYGNYVPRILDEAFEDRQGRRYGRKYAGPEWAIVITMDEIGDYGLAMIARTGFTLEQYDAFGAQARRR